MIAPDQNWEQPPVDLDLPDDEVHLWQMALEQPPDRVASLTHWLSADEQARAARFHFERDRRRFIVSHAGMRQILGQYLNLAPDRVNFSFGAQGKPYLAAELAAEVQFNLAHSHELALLAVTRRRAIGVDVEYVQRPADMLALAARFFATAEYAALINLPEDQQSIGFFNCWTRKEAYLKAVGTGISGGLKHFQVSLQPGELPRFVLIDDSAALAAGWSLIDLQPAPSYIAAAALDCPAGYRTQRYTHMVNH